MILIGPGRPPGATGVAPKGVQIAKISKLF